MKFTLALTTLALAACAAKSGDSQPPQVSLPLPKLNVEPRYFSSCADITNWQQARSEAEAKEYKAYYDWAASQPGGIAIPVAASPGAGSSSSDTNIQEPGVDEPDFSKVSGSNLIVARAGRIEVARLPELRLTQTLNLPGLRSLRLFAPEGKLIAMGTDAEGNTVIKLYRLAENGYQLAAEHKAQGRFIEARLNNDRLLVLSAIYSEWRSIDQKMMGVECTRVQKPVLDFVPNQTTGIYTLSLTTPSVLNRALHMGPPQNIYVSAHNLYFLSFSYSWFFWDARTQTDDLFNSQTLVKFDWSHGAAEYRAAGTVKGNAHNVWAFHENAEQGVLHLATTYSNGANINRLWTLRDLGHDLKITGKSEEFGAREDIRSVRYMDNKAYIVTFEKTDPLFVLDLAIPDEPKILSELKVPGFSSYLHPAGDRLIGVGFGTAAAQGFSWSSGVQVSLFDNRDPLNVRALDQVQFGARYSYADVTTDHHAFFLDGQTMSVPVRLLKELPNSSPWAVSNELEFSGALVFNLSAGIHSPARVSHLEWMPERCRERQAQGSFWSMQSASLDIRRTYRIGDRLLTVSGFGAKVHDGTLRESASLPVADPESECQALLSSTDFQPPLND